MASRSVLGCQHPCLLALGLALAILCSICPNAEAGAGASMLAVNVRRALDEPALELVPGYKFCISSCYDREAPPQAQLIQAAIKRRDERLFAKYGKLDERQMSAIRQEDYVLLHARDAGSMAKCFWDCEDMLGAGEDLVMTKVMIRMQPDEDYIRAVTEDWMAQDPDERAPLVDRVVAKATTGKTKVNIDWRLKSDR